ncbi:hypothetical protein PpBr36_08155 [Pyricularia pennisetigena]|uniref:hypothetical protein n=1 Tax=Pyricularia pennisetigena TaxID=1578925 RepID=UPI00114E9898|nr:hypothetical protein PpBr36_08155 [Pyricularia pennisetigena]TLS24521.1 hypothetical protein PpBr36_08155 [Pyricularia pennisetigena]
MSTKKTAEPPSSPGSSPASSRSSTPEPTTSSKKRKPTTDPEDEIAVDLSAPEPPSKRARRALKKGKPLPKPSSKKKRDDRADLEADDDDDDAANLPEQLRSSSAGGKKERSNYGVWIGNLPFTATRADVFKWLVENSGGSITEDAITRVNLPLSKDKKPGSERRDNKGFAYVDFAAYDACIAAIALSESDYGGRKLLIKDAKSFEGRPAPAAAASAGASVDETKPGKAGAAATVALTPSTNTKKIYVGNLPYDATEETLRWQFEKCGTIEWAKVATFEDSGKCKGYGWVRFAESAACDWAVKGFVKIKEAVETEEDFMSDDEDDKAEEGPKDDNDNDDEEDDAAKKTKRRKPAAGPEKTKTRKWWVNKLKGRPLTIQLAEDDQTRYKKRFGKDAPKTARKGAGGRGPPRSNADSAGGDSAEKNSAEKSAGASLSYHTDINVARLTGAAVAPQGKKVTFD